MYHQSEGEAVHSKPRLWLLKSNIHRTDSLADALGSLASMDLSSDEDCMQDKAPREGRGAREAGAEAEGAIAHELICEHVNLQKRRCAMQLEPRLIET